MKSRLCSLIPLMIFCAISFQAFAVWEVRPELVTPIDQVRSGQAIQIRWVVARNDLTASPTSCQFSMACNSASGAYEDPSIGDQGDMGIPKYLSIKVNYTKTGIPYEKYNTLTNFYTTDSSQRYTLYPICLYSTFQLTSLPRSPIYLGAVAGTDGGTPAPVPSWLKSFGADPGYGNLVNTNTTGYISFDVQRVVATEIVSPVIEAGKTFTIRVKITSNDDLSTPGSCAFRVKYTAAALQLLNPLVGDLGAVSATPEAALGGGLNYRDVSTAGNPSNKNFFPNCFDLTFQAASSPSSPFTIQLEDVPATTTALVKIGGGTLVHIFDNSATQNTYISPVVSTELVGSIVGNQNFQVRVKVSSNDTPSIPISCLFRNNYSKDTVSYVGIASGELGQAFAGTQNTSGTTALFRNAGTMGYFTAVNLQPLCYTLTFKALPHPAKPLFVSLQDPASGESLMEKDTYEHIPHSFNNLATLNLAPNPVTVVTHWDRASGIVPGRDMKVQLMVTQNDWTSTPTACKIRLRYNTASVSYLYSTANDLGTISSVPGSDGFGSYVDVSALENTSANKLLPTCFTAIFHINASPTLPFTITAQDPASGVPLALLNEPTVNIPHVYDLTDTQNLNTTAPSNVPEWQRR